jgi:hypothetical protein
MAFTRSLVGSRRMVAFPTSTSSLPSTSSCHGRNATFQRTRKKGEKAVRSQKSEEKKVKPEEATVGRLMDCQRKSYEATSRLRDS